MPDPNALALEELAANVVQNCCSDYLEEQAERILERQGRTDEE